MKRRWIAVAAAAIAMIAAVVLWRFHGNSAATAKAGSADTAPTAPRIGEQRAAGGGDDMQAAPPILADDGPPGDLRLEGIVLDDHDHPVAGATVVLGSQPPRTAVTEADGGFAFDGLLARSYRVVARAKAGVAGPVIARLTANSEPVTLRLHAGGKLVVTVVGPDAKPIDGASVELRGDDRQTARTDNGEVVFAPVVPGGYTVVASAAGAAPAHQDVRVASGETRARIMLVPGAAVSGRVVDEHGAPVQGARVVYQASGRSFGAQPDWRLDAVAAGTDGTWKFPALAAGSFRFLASDPDHATGTSELVTLDGKTEKSGIAITLPAGAVVRGRVVDTAKQPVGGARVQIGVGFGQRRPGGVRQPPHQAYSDEHGEFTVRGLPREKLVATAQHEKGASSAVDVDATSGEAKDVIITLDLTAEIAGAVVDQAGDAIEGAQVIAIPSARGRGPGAFFGGGGTALTDASGRFKIGGLAVGDYSVQASRSGSFRGRRRGGDGVEAHTGDDKVKIVLPAEGGVQGKVALATGGAPTAYTISIGATRQAFFASDFALDSIAPGDYILDVTGPQFDAHSQNVTVEPGKVADVGSIVVTQGRSIGGIVVSNGQPVAGATVYAGPQVMGGAASNDSPMRGYGNLGANTTKQDTTDANGVFSLAGFGGGDLTVIADLPAIGRSTPLRVTEDAQNQTSLVLALQAYGAISGSLVEGGQPGAGIAVTAQSTSTPGAIYATAAGSDGKYRFDQLAPDTYKVSATLGTPRRGMHQYSQQVTVPAGGEAHADLTVDAGAVEVDATPTSTKELGAVVAYLTTATLTATNASQLSLQLAAAGPGTSQITTARGGEPAKFTDTAAGTNTLCMVPLPPDLRGGAAQSYMQQHAAQLTAFCTAITVQASPAVQAVSLAVTPPPPTGTGSGAGSGSGR